MPVLTPGLTKEVSAEGNPCPVAGLSLYDADFILKVPLAKLSPTRALLRPPRVGDALGTGPSCFTRVGGGGGGEAQVVASGRGAHAAPGEVKLPDSECILFDSFARLRSFWHVQPFEVAQLT